MAKESSDRSVRNDPDPDALCLQTASRQHGVIARGQALAAGLSPDAIYRRVRTGRWVKLLPRVYRALGAAESWQQKAVAASLWSGPAAALSRRAAAVLWELDGFTAGKIDLTTARHLKAPAPWIAVHRGQLSPGDLRRIGITPVTSVDRTLFDLSTLVEEETLEAALESAFLKGLTSPGRLNRLLAQVERKPKALSRFIDQRTGDRPAESMLEIKQLRLLRKSPLPRPVQQYEIRSDGTLIARVDFAYPDALLAIECDGYRYHSGRAAWGRDWSRANRLSALGWRLIRVTWDDIHNDPAGVVERISASLSHEPRISRLE